MRFFSTLVASSSAALAACVHLVRLGWPAWWLVLSYQFRVTTVKYIRHTQRKRRQDWFAFMANLSAGPPSDVRTRSCVLVAAKCSDSVWLSGGYHARLLFTQRASLCVHGSVEPDLTKVSAFGAPAGCGVQFKQSSLCGVACPCPLHRSW